MFVTCNIMFRLAVIQDRVRLNQRSHPSQLRLTHSIAVIVSRSLSSVDDVVASLEFSGLGEKASQGPPHPIPFAFRYPSAPLHPTVSSRPQTLSHLSLYLCLPNCGGQRARQALPGRAPPFPPLPSPPSPTNSLITAHSPKCVCNVGNHFQ